MRDTNVKNELKRGQYITEKVKHHTWMKICFCFDGTMQIVLTRGLKFFDFEAGMQEFSLCGTSSGVALLYQFV